MNNNNRFGILYSAVHFIASICILIQLIDVCNGHGRLLEPPGRSSAWRFGFKVPINYNDDELFCGGLFHQIGLDGKCGVCGDAWDAPEPRPNEYGGTYGLGVVVRKYQPGAEIPIGIQLTTSHMGYFEFRVCPKLRPTQECLDQNLLEVISGSPSSSQPNDLHTRFYPRHGSVKYDIVARLPEGLECGNCVLQWKYTAGNNWGTCPDGRGAMGCGPQEEFRGCADITIGNRRARKPLPLRIPITP